MNIAFFLLPKHDVAYLHTEDTLRQGLEKFSHYGYTAVPVIDAQGRYQGVISEGDFLWHFIEAPAAANFISRKQAEQEKIGSILNKGKYPAVHITASIETLIAQAMDQNFVPVVDDRETFIGIVTRRDIIRYYMQKYGAAASTSTAQQLPQDQAAANCN